MGFKINDFTSNSLYERVNKLLVSYEWSDCSFLVCGKKFKAHKLILGISSPVFEAMFYGPLSSDEDISITDIAPEIFQLLLNYIYTDKVEILSIEESFELLYVSRKYLLKHLSEICISFIQSNITVDNVITILNYPDYMQDDEVIASSLKLLCEHPNYILRENLKHISLACMQRILQCNDMNINEKDLIKYVFKWTSHQCTQSDDSEEFERRRNLIIENGLFKLLRFTALSLEELNEVFNDENNLLLPSESDFIRNNIQGFNRPANMLMITDFANNSFHRNPIKLQWMLCHRSQLRSMSPVLIDAHHNSIQTRLKVNKPVFINSFSVPSRMAPDLNFYNNSNTVDVYCEQFTVSIVNENGNSIIENFNLNRNTEYDSSFDVEFSQPVFLKNNQWYTIDLVWPQQSTYYCYSYAVQRRERIFNNGKIEFQFEDLLSANDNGGSFIKGVTFCL